MKTSRVVLGVMAGAAAGALLGVLFAPDKGSVTRKKITKKGNGLMEDLKGQVEYYRGKAADAVDQFADSIHSQVADIPMKSANGRSKAAHTERHS